MNPRFARTVGFLIVLFFLASGVYGFADTNATVSGFVTDAQDKVVTGAKVVLTNVNTGLKYEIETNGTGFYRQSELPPGVYRANVSKEGFAGVVKDDIELHVQDDVSINFSLRVGSVSESITVEGGIPLVNTETATVSTVVDRQFVENLPLNGRSFQALIDLTPGVVITPAQIGNEGQFSTDGQRTDTNYFTIDGVSANIGTDQGGSGTLYRNAAGTLPGFSILGGTNNLVSVDAMQQFRIQTSNFSAEYGRTPGDAGAARDPSGSRDLPSNPLDRQRDATPPIRSSGTVHSQKTTGEANGSG